MDKGSAGSKHVQGLVKTHAPAQRTGAVPSSDEPRLGAAAVFAEVRKLKLPQASESVEMIRRDRDGR
jgi:hypothetical protein